MNYKNKLFAVIIAAIICVVVVMNFNQDVGEKIKIGVIIPLSGPAASIAEDFNLILNDYQSIAENIEFVIQDDQCSGKNALSAYNMMKAQGIRIYMVACSGSILSLAPLVAEDNNVIVTGYGGSIEIRKTGDEVIRFIPDGLSIAEGVIRFIKQNPNTKYAIFSENQDYPKSIVDKLRQEVGAQIMYVDSYNASDSSFKTHILKLQASVADSVIYIPVSETAREIVYKEMQQLGFNKKILGEVNVCDSTILPKDFGLHGTCFKTVLTTNGFDTFVEDFSNTHARQPRYAFYNAISLDIAKITDRFFKNVDVVTDEVISQFKGTILSGISGDVTSYKFTLDGEVIGGEYLEQVDF